MSNVEAPERPWVQHYPPGISWDVPINTTPVHEQVLAACTRYPEADALDFLGKKTSFRELGHMINAFAGALQAQFGVRKGTRVALLLPNTPFYVVAYYAVLRAGGTVVNCNPLYTLHELSHIVGNSGAELMVTLDIKQVFEKAEGLSEAGHIRQIIVAPFPRRTAARQARALQARQGQGPLQPRRIPRRRPHHAFRRHADSATCCRDR